MAPWVPVDRKKNLTSGRPAAPDDLTVLFERIDPVTETTLPEVSPATPTSVSRRTVLIGSAFAVPAITLTAATPALAVSGPTLAFNQPSYTAPGCSTISGVKITAQEAGAPKAGIAVTASLSTGYTFSDGSSSTTSTTGADGTVTLLAINVPSVGGSGTITATASGATSTTSTLTGTAPTFAAYLRSGTRTAGSGVPANAKPLSGGLFLTRDKDVIDAVTGKTLVKSVDAAGTLLRDGTDTWLATRYTDGTTGLVRNTTQLPTTGNVDPGSTPIGYTVFLSPDGRLVDGFANKQYATGIRSVGTITIDAAHVWWLALAKTDGTFSYIQGKTQNSTGVANTTEIPCPAIPAGSTPTAAGFLTKDGRLLDRTGNVLATNVAKVGTPFVTGSPARTPLQKTDGTASYLENNTEKTAVDVPYGSTPLTDAAFLTVDGLVIDGTTGKLIAADVATPGGVFVDANNQWVIPLSVWTTTPTLFRVDQYGYTYDYAAKNTPAGSTAVAYSYFRTPDNKLVDGQTGTVLANDIDTWGWIFTDAQKDYALPLRKTDGTTSFILNGTETATVGVPANSRPIGNSSFLTADGRLIRGKDGTIEATGVKAVGQIFLMLPNFTALVPLLKTDGSCVYLEDGVEKAAQGVPNGSQPVASTYFRTTDGRLIDGATATVTATNVDIWGQIWLEQYLGNQGNWDLPLRKTDGSFTLVRNASEIAAQNVPAGSIPATAAGFLAPNGDFLNGFGGTVERTGIATFGQTFLTSGNEAWRAYGARPQTC